jgi:hypothetical protein
MECDNAHEEDKGKLNPVQATGTKRENYQAQRV